MKLTASIFSLLAGVLVGAVALGGYWYWQHDTTEVWVAMHTLQSDNGIVVPKGTKLVLKRWMPEGFAALELAINVEGETLDQFQRDTEQESFLRIPYFVYAGDE